MHTPSFDPLDVRRWQEFAVHAEQAGISRLAVGESGGTEVQLTALALATSSATFGAMVTNPVTRHPAVMAGALGALTRVSGGRAYLGIGVGNSAVRLLGLPPARLTDLREYIDTFRDLLDRGEATYRGAPCVARSLGGGLRVPVHVAANGPKSLQLAGAIGDGVIVGSGVSAPVVAHALEQIEIGARASGRTLDDLEVWFQIDMNIVHDPSVDAISPMRDILSAFASRGFRETLEGKFVPPELEEPLRRFVEDYSYVQHASKGSTNSDLLDRHGLTDFVVERWLVAGTPDEVVERLRTIRGYGVRNVHLTCHVPDRRVLVDDVGALVLPAVAGL
jgi:5,10-methylenetetrahydromethanopterin reductase